MRGQPDNTATFSVYQTIIHHWQHIAITDLEIQYMYITYSISCSRKQYWECLTPSQSEPGHPISAPKGRETEVTEGRVKRHCVAVACQRKCGCTGRGRCE